MSYSDSENSFKYKVGVGYHTPYQCGKTPLDSEKQRRIV